jgi:hypothetical protein
MNAIEKWEYNKKIKTEVFDFCQSDIKDKQKLDKTYQYICAELEGEFVNERTHECYQRMVVQHYERQYKGTLLATFQSQILPAPMLRMGFLIVTLQPAEYACFQQIALQNEITIEACVNQMFQHEPETLISKEGYLLRWYIFYDAWKLKPIIFWDFGLKGLKKLALVSYHGAILDTTGLGYQTISAFSCSGCNSNCRFFCKVF